MAQAVSGGVGQGQQYKSQTEPLRKVLVVEDADIVTGKQIGRAHV